MNTASRHPYLLSAFDFIWKIIGAVIPKSNSLVVFHSFPDFDDTCRAIERSAIESNLKLVILTGKRTSKPPLWFDGHSTIVHYKYSVMGLYLYHRAKIIIFTHGLHSNFSLNPRQYALNVWHGMPIKNIGLLDKNTTSSLPVFNATIAYNSFFGQVISQCFGISDEQILIERHPRIDILIDPPGFSVNTIFNCRSKRLCVWLPTYRKAYIGDLREDGDPALDVFTNSTVLRDLDSFFLDRDVVCVIKPHPMTEVDQSIFSDLRAIQLIDEDFLTINGLTLYQVLGHSDFLITDLSSVYFDYQYTDKPIVLYCVDFDSYASSRGFVRDPASLIKHRITTTTIELKERINAVLNNQDNYSGPTAPIDRTPRTTRLLNTVLQRLNIR